MRLQLPRGRHHIHDAVVRNVLHVKGVHNSLSQLRLMDRALRIVPVNDYGINIYDKVPAESTGLGRGNLVDMARQIGGL